MFSNFLVFLPSVYRVYLRITCPAPLSLSACFALSLSFPENLCINYVLVRELKPSANNMSLYDSKTRRFSLSVSLLLVYFPPHSPLSRTPPARECRWSVGLQCESTHSGERCPCPFRMSPSLVAPSEEVKSSTINAVSSLRFRCYRCLCSALPGRSMRCEACRVWPLRFKPNSFLALAVVTRPIHSVLLPE